jgi:hypothetical protein
MPSEDLYPAGYEAEFLRSDLAGWRITLYTLYGDCAEEIVEPCRQGMLGHSQ